MSDIENGEKPLILIIDDSKENLHFLCDIFVEYRKSVTVSGIEGIKLASSLKPDLILLDILMPEINGFDVCRAIKENPDNIDIPIIFLSGKTKLEDIVKGLKLGAVDYVTKPFEQEELKVRVKTNLELKASKDMIKRQSKKLAQLNDDLRHFLAIATHDLKNSLLVIQGFTKLLIERYQKFSDVEKMDLLSDIAVTGETMYKIIMNLSYVTRLEEGKVQPYFTEFDINYLLDDSINYFKEIAKAKNININYINKIKQLSVYQDLSLIKECIDNLLSNAIKFSPMQSQITVIAYSESINKNMRQMFVVEVEDEGPGIKEEEQPLLFKKFARLSSQATNHEITTGLGLAITKMIVELLNGEVSYISQHSKGSKFVLKFPATMK
ncbi:MAG: hybrid sensor histidine kinase/response regulator [Candidatus Kapabacteria bacterium]|nr:hybrid sensor histidine kinase/response regulator [Candidatus Kapabacteria bacterium]